MHHLIAKDILRFHCVYWPAMLLAAGEEPPSRISVHGYLLVGGEKMSKTGLNQIFPADLVHGDDEKGFAAFGVDGFRYHFLRDNPFGPDGDFSYEGMVGRFNADLANNLGNLMSRVATVVAKKCDGIGPAPTARQPAGGGGRRGLRRDRRPLGRRRALARAGGHLAADPGGQRPPRGQRAVEAGPWT